MKEKVVLITGAMRRKLMEAATAPAIVVQL